MAIQSFSPKSCLANDKLYNSTAQNPTRLRKVIEICAQNKVRAKWMNMFQRMLAQEQSSVKSRMKRQESLFLKALPILELNSYISEFIQCNMVTARLCPGAGIGCTICQQYSNGLCASVCSVKSIICNAAYMRCF